MTTPAPTVVKTVTEGEIRDVTHYCHFSGFAARADLSRVNFVSDGTL